MKFGHNHMPILRSNLAHLWVCCAPKFLVDPLGGPSMAMQKELELGARFQLLALEGGKRGVLEVPGKTKKS